MDMTGSYRVAAAREKVWQALNDPEILRQCLPGCEEVEKLSATEFTAKLKAKVGPVSARFAGKVTLSELDPPRGYTITGEGSGGAAGFGKGSAQVLLESEGDAATVLSYTAHAQVGGKLAQIGSRLVDAAARKMADDFFSRFGEVVGGAPPVQAGATVSEPEPPTPESSVRERLAEEPIPIPVPAPPERVSGPPAGDHSRLWLGVAAIAVLATLAVLLT